MSFHRNSKNTLWNCTKRIYFIQVWMIRRRWLANICTGQSLEKPYRRNSQDVTCSNVQNWLPDKMVEETPWNKLYVDLIGPYKIRRNGKKLIILNDVTMIYHVTGWFKVMQYRDKKAMTITNLVETTYPSRYHLWPRRRIPWSRV